MEELRNKHHIDMASTDEIAVSQNYNEPIDIDDLGSDETTNTAALPDPRDVEYQAMKAAGLLPGKDSAQESAPRRSMQRPAQRSAETTSQRSTETPVQRPAQRHHRADDAALEDIDIYTDASDLEDYDDARSRALDRRERSLERREEALQRRQQAVKEQQRSVKARQREQKRQGTDDRRDRRDRSDTYRDEKPRKKRHPIRNFLLILLLLILAVVGWFLYKVNSMIDGGLSLRDLESYISEEVRSSTASGAMAGYTNIALFGLDSTEGDLSAGNNRSDIMIIASINNKTGAIKLVSLYRDTYLDIGDDNYQKANAAYAYGGPEQAVAMLNKNLDLNITDYVVTGFEGIASVIDAVGGIEIDVAEDEISHLNNYQTTMSQETGLAYKEVTQAGPQTLTGLQATAYCRIRYTDGGDFKRTERQKEVLSKTFDKLKSSGPLTMISVASTVMSKVRTSLSMTEIAALALKATTYSIADTNGLPIESLRTVGYIGDQSCVIPIHLSDNVVWLHQYLFDDQSYAVSSTVQSISDTISARSGY